MARRVNTRFVGILGSIIVGLIIVGIAADKLLIRDHPDHYIQAARDALAQHKYADAVDNWKRAWALSPNDPSLPTEMGNAYNAMAPEDPQVNLKQLDLQLWERALEINPNYVPAVKALVRYWEIRVQAAPSPTAFRSARQRAEQMHKLAPNDPDDKATQAFSYDLTVEEGLAGFETDQARLADAEKQIIRLQQEDPTNPQLPYHLALLAVRRGVDAQHSNSSTQQDAAATAQFNRAMTIMNDAVKAQPENAGMHFYTATIEHELSDSDHSTPDARQRYRLAAQQEIDQSIALLKPADPTFVDVSLRAARLEIREDNFAKAQEVLSNLLKARGNDVDVAVHTEPLVANVPTLRAQVAATLQNDIDVSPKNNLSIDRRRLSEEEALCDLRIVDYSEAAPADRPKLANQILAALKIMDESHRDAAAVAKLTARFDMAGNDFVGAIQVLEPAAKSIPTVADDLDCIWMLAKSYSQANQNAAAIEWCNKAVAKNPGFLDARKLLARLLTADNSENAQVELGRQVDEMVRLAPNDSEVIRWQIRLIKPGDTEQLKALYARLPEETVEDVREKGAIAVARLHDKAEAERLFSRAIAMDPQQPGDYIMLASLYGTGEQKPQAIATLQRGVAAIPGNTQLALYLKQLQGATTQELDEFAQQQRTDQSDPASRELVLASQARQQNLAADEEKHLKLAEAADANNLSVANGLYALYVRTGRFELAGPYLARLKQANADQAHGLLLQFGFDRAQGDGLKMMTDAQALVTSLPEFAQSYLSLGRAFEAQGNYEQAIANFDVAIQKKSDLFDARLEKIQCEYQLNRLDAASQAINDAARAFPGNAQFHTLQIQHQITYGEPSQAVTTLEDDLKKNPNDANAVIELATANQRIAQMRRDGGDADGAKAAANLAHDELTDAVARFPDDSRFYGALAQNLAQSGDIKGAEGVLQAFDARPAWHQRQEPQLMLASLYAQTNQADQAVASFKLAFDRSHGDPAIQINYASYLAGLQRFDDAIALLNSANTSDSRVVRQHIAVLILGQRYDEAERAINDEMVRRPQDASDLSAQLAQVNANRGKTQAAVDDLGKSLAANPQNAAALFLRGRLRASQSPPDLEGAINDFLKASQIDATSVPILTALADAYALRFDSTQATHAMARALSIDPNNLPIRLQLAQMYATSHPPKLDEALQVLEDGRSLPGSARSPDIDTREALIYQQKDQLDKALDIAVAARARFPKDPMLGRTYFSLLTSTHQYDKVLADSDSMAADPQSPWWIWDARGVAHGAGGDKLAATDDLTKALLDADKVQDIDAQQVVIGHIAKYVGFDAAINTVEGRLDRAEVWAFALVKLYHEKGDDAAAIKRLEPLMADIDHQPANTQVNRLALAGAFYATAKPNAFPDKAYAAYIKLLAISPNDVAALNNIACLCADGFNPPHVQEGLGYINKAIGIVASQGTSEPLFYDTQGWLMVLSGDIDQGMAVLRKALQRRSFPEVHYHMAEGFVRQNHIPEAQREINLALQAINDDQRQAREIDPQTVIKVNALAKRVLELQSGH